MTHRLAPITPLGGTEPQVDRFPGLTISENPNRALASLAARLGDEAKVSKAAKTLLGVDLPGPGRMAFGAEMTAFWMGPESWMIDADHAAHELLAGEVKAAVGDGGSVVEQTDGWCRFDLDGSRSADVFERLCNVDIRKMETGAATRTSIEHLGCFLLCIREGMEFAVVGPRSSAGSLHHALVTAAKSAI